jgi:HAMP domain-containing protein
MPLLGGIRPPVAALLVLLLTVAGTVALVLGRADDTDVPVAVLTSQQHVAEDGATALRAALDESTTDLQRSATMLSAAKPIEPDQVLSTLGKVYRKWRGTAVVDLSSGDLLAARGENVPLSAIDLSDLPKGLPPRLVATKYGETRLLVFALLDRTDGQQLLVASDSLQVPSIATGSDRTLQVVDSSGKILVAQGPDARKEAAKALGLRAVRAASGQRPSETAASGGFDGPSGIVVGGASKGFRTVGGYASVTAGVSSTKNTSASSGKLGLTVLTTVKVAQDPESTDHRLFALIAAGTLLLLAAAVTWVVLRILQRPLLRLHIEARRLSRGDYSRPVDIPRFGEPALVGAALESLRKQLLGAPAGADRTVLRRQKDRTGITTVLVICAVLVLSWAAPLLFLLNRADNVAVVPQQMVTDQQRRTETAADRVREGLNEGYADLASVATVVSDDSTKQQLRRVLETTLAEHSRYRALYVVDENGTVIARAGGEPRVPLKARTRDGIGLVDDTRKEPVIAGRAPVGTAKKHRTVVGEYDIQFLNGILSRPGLGKVWLVDADKRIVASNRGFRAFQLLPDSRVRDAADSAEHSSIGTLLRTGDTTIGAAAPLVGSGEAATFLRWHVVSALPAAWLDLPEFEAQRRTVLGGLLGLAAASTCLGWLYIVVVRPLRGLSDNAEALVAGDRKTVLFPVHHDEVGSVVRSLELIRQRLVEQQKAGVRLPQQRDPAAVPMFSPGSPRLPDGEPRRPGGSEPGRRN